MPNPILVVADDLGGGSGTGTGSATGAFGDDDFYYDEYGYYGDEDEQYYEYYGYYADDFAGYEDYYSVSGAKACNGLRCTAVQASICPR